MNCPQCEGYANPIDIKEYNMCYDCVLIEQTEYERAEEEAYAMADCYG